MKTKAALYAACIALILCACGNPLLRADSEAGERNGWPDTGGGGGITPPVITGQPQDAAYNQNDSAAAITVTALAQNGGILAYQWYSNSVNSAAGSSPIGGATTNSYTPPTGTQGIVYYYVVVTDPANGLSTVSNAAKIEVTTAPVYTWNTPPPQSANGVSASVSYSAASGTAGTSVTATVSLSGTATNAGQLSVNLSSSAATPSGGSPINTAQTVTVTAGQTTFSGKTFTFTVPSANVTDFTLSFSFIPRTFTVVYNGNGSTGGSVPVDGATYTEGASVTLPGNTGSLQKTGWVFDGWKTSASGLTTITSLAAADTSGSNYAAVKNLYAHWKLPGGSGSPWEISDAEGLAKIGTGGYGLDADYELTGNVTIPPGTWTPIGTLGAAFTGTLDGNGNTITYNNVTMGSGFSGLFGNAEAGSVIKNLKFTGTLTINVSSNTYAGVVAGRLLGTIQNCASDVAVSLTASGTGTVLLGGIASNAGTVENCYATGTVTAVSQNAEAYAGGIAGNNSGTISYCYASGIVSATAAAGQTAQAGGIAGRYPTASVTNCAALNPDLVIGGGTPTLYRVGGSGASNYGLDDMKYNGATGHSWTGAYNGADVSLAATQAGNTQSWWQTTMGFVFGADEDHPWKWDSTLQRPVLWFE